MSNCIPPFRECSLGKDLEKRQKYAVPNETLGKL